MRIIPSLVIFSSLLLFYGGSLASSDTSSVMVIGTSRSGESSCRFLLRHCPLFLLLLWVGLLEVPAPLSKLGLSLEPSLDGLLLPVDSIEAFIRSTCIQASTSASSSSSYFKTSPSISCTAPDLMTSCLPRKPILCFSP